MLVYRAGIAILLVGPLSRVAGSLAGTSVNLIVLVTGAGLQLIFIMIMNVVSMGGWRGGEEAVIEHCGAPHTQSLTFTLLSESKCEGERLGVWP